ncbi:MAG: Nmad2 family putative nucleotide modification protein [Marinobacter sp.]
MFSYLVIYDSGFAPNPFQGFLIRSTAKSLVQKTRSVGPGNYRSNALS